MIIGQSFSKMDVDLMSTFRSSITSIKFQKEAVAVGESTLKYRTKGRSIF